MRIDIEEFADAIKKTLEDYMDVTDEAAYEGCKVTAEGAVDELHEAHPNKEKSWDNYNKGWAVKEVTKKRSRKTSLVVHNATHYRLTHLLEKGHEKVNGGRTRAFPHIAPVAEKAEDALLDNIKQFLDR